MAELNNQFTVENIERSLHHFYHDVESQAQANKFLISAQTSQEAWQFAWQLLHPSKTSEAQFFGACTLHTKISKQWNELPPDHYSVLRDRLLEALFTYVTGPKIILTRLCITMSSFIIQTIADFWPSAISDLISAFQPCNIPNTSPQQVANVLLELLTVLSEEFQTSHLSHPRLGIVRNALRESLKLVMDIVQNILSKTSAPADLCEISLKCYSGWAMLGADVFEYKSLLLLAFDSVYREEISQTALETLTNIANLPESSKYPSVILEMIDHINHFDELIKKASQDYDMDKLNSIYSLIIIIGENHCQLLLNTILDKPEKKDAILKFMGENHCQLLLNTILDKPEKKDAILKFMGFVLQCSSTPGQYPVDEICSEQAFGFWYTLQDAIVSSSREFENLLLTFHPIFQTLLDAYMVKLRYPPENVYKQWKSDEKESFRCYRQDIGDSIMYCHNILRNAALANLMAHLDIATSTASSNPSQWQYLEACLFALKEIAESVDIKENQFIPAIMTYLRNMPLQHIRIISAAMEVIGAFAEWINSHPDVLGCVIPLLLMGLQNTDVAISATFALKDISRDCFSSMHPFAEQILHTSLDALKGNILKSREKVRIMATIGKVLSVMPYSFTMEYLDTLLSPIFNELQENICSNEITAQSATIIVHDLHMISMLFATLDTRFDKEFDGQELENEVLLIRNNNLEMPQPSLHILERLLAIMRSIGSNWEVTEQVTEALCDALKRAVSMLSDSCKVFLPDLLNLLLNLYKQCPHSSVLDMTKQLLVLFVNDLDERPSLSKYFATVCDHTIQISMKDFRESTAVIESFLHVLDQIIKKAIIFFKDESVNPLVLFQFGAAALNLPEKPTVRAAASFLAEFITHSREVPSMLNVVNSQGEMLIMQVIKVIGGDSPRSVVEFMPDILMAFNKKYFDNLCRWVVSFTQQEGFPSFRVTQRQKEEFARLVLK
ncbi:importin-13 [Trichonephila inaurata madagascariensis]|uniref:Importin-13 n=1 Tax=Trichonephila inaurata madagascariensis TaxID=2747483 RepID=A0A8X6XHN1_9ARAC|nr:importin-13 [Trichonephila inaurata madagascariensis]